MLIRGVFEKPVRLENEAGVICNGVGLRGEKRAVECDPSPPKLGRPWPYDEKRNPVGCDRDGPPVQGRYRRVQLRHDPFFRKNDRLRIEKAAVDRKTLREDAHLPNMHDFDLDPRDKNHVFACRYGRIDVQAFFRRCEQHRTVSRDGGDDRSIPFTFKPRNNEGSDSD